MAKKILYKYKPFDIVKIEVKKQNGKIENYENMAKKILYKK